MTATESAQILAFVLLVVFLAYVLAILVPFLRRRPDREGDADAFTWHAFVPCRDEEVVIGATIERMRSRFPAMHVWVIDDDSDDRSAAIIAGRAAVDPHVHLVQRRRPAARTGKGDALNAAYAQLDAWLPAGTDRAAVVVVVVDADGILAENALRQAAGRHAFGNPATGACQAAVWMSNRDDRDPAGAAPGRLGRWWSRYLIRMQDIEFRTTIAAMQCLRGRTLSVGLGGNGQFTRLSALDAIAQGERTPWHGSLLEDYELGVHVMLAGFRNVYLHDTHVEQEALPGTRRLLTQRTRWCQGGMQCARYLLRIFTSPHVTNAGALEASYFLVQPYLQMAGVLLWPTVFVAMVAQGSVSEGSFWAWFAEAWWLLPLVVITGIAPFALWPLIYRRHIGERTGLGTALGWALGYWIYMYQSYVCVPRAFTRILTSRNGWAKTRRNAETDHLFVAKEA